MRLSGPKLSRMDETFRQLDRLRESESRVAVATLVATRGTTPKKEGAKMWVGEGGRVLGSVTIGGCVDARVIAEAERVIASAEPALLSMDLGDEDAWELGLTCGGTVDVLVEPIDLRREGDPLGETYAAARAETERGRHAVVVTTLAGGRRAVVSEDGVLSGTLGDPALDAEARDRALETIARGASRTTSLISTGDAREAFFELHGPAPTLAIFGAGHVAMPLVSMARVLGFRTIVVDARERFATKDRFPDADEIRLGIPSEIAESMAWTPSTFVILVAHDYKYDIPVLRRVLESRAAYVGLLGSRRRGESIKRFLREEGMPEDALARVHVPIGLDIGAQSAAEIALSILAEAVAVRAGRPGGSMKARETGARPPQETHSA